MFPAYSVDFEYNRHDLDPKSVHLPEGCKEGGGRLIYPDIIVHQRRTDAHNLLAIELKKETNRESRECDKAKLEAMKRELNYKNGALIELPAGAGATNRNYILKWVE
jgi:hypothetical protein